MAVKNCLPYSLLSGAAVSYPWVPLPMFSSTGSSLSHFVSLWWFSLKNPHPVIPPSNLLLCFLPLELIINWQCTFEHMHYFTFLNCTNTSFSHYLCLIQYIRWMTFTNIFLRFVYTHIRVLTSCFFWEMPFHAVNNFLGMVQCLMHVCARGQEPGVKVQPCRKGHGGFDWVNNVLQSQKGQLYPGVHQAQYS